MGVFNGLPRVVHAINSIRNQTIRDFEFLIIDDGSTDGTDRVIRRHAEADSRVRIIRNEANQGLGSVLACGVREAQGEFIARMDADDVSVPDRLEKQVKYFDTHPETDVVGSYALDVGTDGSVLGERRVPTTHEKISERVWSNPFVHATVMFRRDSILKVGSYSPALRRRQDYDLWFRCVNAGLELANIPEPLVHYLYSEETVRRNNVRATWDQVRIGLRGCRLVRAPLHAYVGTCMPLVESAMPRWLRSKLLPIKSMIDPRRVP